MKSRWQQRCTMAVALIVFFSGAVDIVRGQGVKPSSPMEDLESDYLQNSESIDPLKNDAYSVENLKSTFKRVLQSERTFEDEEDVTEELGVVVTFEDILKLTVFIAAAWIMSNLSVMLGLPGLVGEIITGFLLGPPLADFCPFPEAMVLIGNFGLLGLMLESGVHLDIGQLRETGTRAVLMALTGTILGLSTGLGLSYFQAENTFSSAMAVGACFAPSSLGVAAAVLSAGGVLNTPISQLIVASSVVDDVLGLILLGILNVFAMDDPTAFNFVQPFLASFGFLAILGYAGIAIIPHLLQDKIMPRVPADYRDTAVFAFMFFLMIAYLPVLNYSGASYLTGAFLAGLSVSQLPSSRTTYEKNGRELMVWLMRIFFSATIGFQIPILRYGDMNVLRWSAKFLVPVLAKLPLGLLIPRFRKEVPEDFPFDPYWRDVWITSLSVMCRGEFNVVVASFALSSGLISADIYSAVCFAILISAVMGPLLLSKVIKYYSGLSEKYLSEPHPLQRVNEHSKDGYRPLFIAIQIRTPVSWGLQERFQHVLQDLGLLILDHRTSHTNSYDAVALSEIFVQDTLKNVKVKNCFSDETSTTNSSISDSQQDESTGRKHDDSKTSLSDRVESGCVGLCNGSAITIRLKEIQDALELCLDGLEPEKYAIKTTQWEPFIKETPVEGKSHRRQRTYTFQDTTTPLDDVVGNLDNEIGDALFTQEYASTFVSQNPDETFAKPTPPDENEEENGLPNHNVHTDDDIFDSLSADLGVELENECEIDATKNEDIGVEEQLQDINIPTTVITPRRGSNAPSQSPFNTPIPALPKRPSTALRHRRSVSINTTASMSNGQEVPVVLSRPARVLDRSVSLGLEASGTSSTTSPFSSIPRPGPMHTRAVSHGQSPLRHDLYSPRQSYTSPRRRGMTTGQCDGKLMDCDLWETDEVARRCVRRGSYVHQTTKAGYCTEKEIHNELQALADRYEGSDEEGETNFWNNTSMSDYQRDNANDQKETVAIQRLLHGYIRH